MYSQEFHAVMAIETFRDPETQKYVDVRPLNCFTMFLQYYGNTVFRYNKYLHSLKRSSEDNYRENCDMVKGGTFIMKEGNEPTKRRRKMKGKQILIVSFVHA